MDGSCFTAVSVVVTTLSKTLVKNKSFLRRVSLLSDGIGRFTTSTLLVYLVALGVTRSVVTSGAMNTYFNHSFVLVTTVPLTTIVNCMITIVMFVVVVLCVILVTVDMTLKNSSSNSNGGGHNVLDSNARMIRANDNFLNSAR